MAYTVVNLVTFLIGVAFLLSGYNLVRRGREDIALFLVSALIGGGLIVVAVFPGIFQWVAGFLGIAFQDVSRGRSRAIFVISILTLFLIVTYLFNRIGKLYDDVSRLNEELSLLKTEVEERRDE